MGLPPSIHEERVWSLRIRTIPITQYQGDVTVVLDYYTYALA